MDIQDPRLRSQLRQANKVADAGKRNAAEQLYRQLIEEAPRLAEAWFGLGEVIADVEERKKAYQQALLLKLDYADAARALAALRGEPTPAWAKEVAAEVEEVAVEASSQPDPQEHAHTAVSATDAAEFELVCYRHSNRTTSLRCYNCSKPICSSCAVKTPVGYSCPDCIRDKEAIFFNAEPFDYIIAPAIGLVLSLIAGYLVARFASGSFFLIFIMLFVGGFVGRIIGQFSKQAIGRRRGRYLPHIMVATLIFGTAVWLLPIILIAGFASLFSFIGPAVFLFGAGTALFSYMK